MLLGLLGLASSYRIEGLLVGIALMLVIAIALVGLVRGSFPRADKLENQNKTPRALWQLPNSTASAVNSS
jgi:hypothetical protein